MPHSRSPSPSRMKDSPQEASICHNVSQPYPRSHSLPRLHTTPSRRVPSKHCRDGLPNSPAQSTSYMLQSPLSAPQRYLCGVPRRCGRRSIPSRAWASLIRTRPRSCHIRQASPDDLPGSLIKPSCLMRHRSRTIFEREGASLLSGSLTDCLYADRAASGRSPAAS